LQAHNKASVWFDDIYNEHQNAMHKIPWAKLEVNPLLQNYLDASNKHAGKALVIGCGLGDDARALELAGYDVLAIDVSQKALELAKARFEESSIVFEKQDIFDMPSKYHRYFDFVFEAYTVQSIPVDFREKMIDAVSKTVAVGGELLVIAHKKRVLFLGPPWPLSEEDIALFKNHLHELHFEIHPNKKPFALEQFCVLYKRQN
jgi:2-polyprenyl-3-methyl-5-hydroxy-6-metoxy-1,4-benzoquinol methylase